MRFLIGAHYKGQLVSWCLTQFDGSIGMVFTLPAFRQLGLAAQLNLELASELFTLQEHVFAFVGHGNVSSRRLFEKLGYQQTSSVDWIAVRRNNK